MSDKGKKEIWGRVLRYRWRQGGGHNNVCEGQEELMKEKRAAGGFESVIKLPSISRF